MKNMKYDSKENVWRSNRRFQVRKVKIWLIAFTMRPMEKWKFFFSFPFSCSHTKLIQNYVQNNDLDF